MLKVGMVATKSGIISLYKLVRKMLKVGMVATKSGIISFNYRPNQVSCSD